jgi:DNA topoisomerase III
VPSAAQVKPHRQEGRAGQKAAAKKTRQSAQGTAQDHRRQRQAAQRCTGGRDRHRGRSRPEAVKKLWDYIKANGLQDATNKRNINADAKLAPVFGKPQVTMFEIAGVLGTTPQLNPGDTP